MIESLYSFAVCYALGVVFWYGFRFYYLRRGIRITTYHAVLASILSTIVITIITRLFGVDGDGCVISGIIVMALFSLGKSDGREIDRAGLKKTMLFLLIGCLCAGFINGLLLVMDK